MNFNQSSYGVMEDDGAVNIMIILSQASSVQFQVVINTADATAVGMLIYIFIIIDVSIIFMLFYSWRGL